MGSSATMSQMAMTRLACTVVCASWSHSLLVSHKAVLQSQYMSMLPCVIPKKMQMALIAMSAVCIPCSSALYAFTSAVRPETGVMPLHATCQFDFFY